MALGSRIRHYREKSKLTLEQLSERSGVDVGTISALENRDSSRSKYATAIAQGLGMTVEMLEAEDQDYAPSAAAPKAPAPAAAPIGVPAEGDVVPYGYVRLQHLSPTPSMGPGRGLSEPVQIIRHLDVLESWVRQKVGSTNYDRIKILTGCGQSMLPTINDHDLVFVDMGQKSIDVPGIYVLDVCDRLLLKRALIHSTGTLVLRSDNAEEFPDEERIDLRTAADSINVAGRVKAWWTLHQG